MDAAVRTPKLELNDEEGCDVCGQTGRTVRLPLKFEPGIDVYLCEGCLTEAMLLIRPFSVLPKLTA